MGKKSANGNDGFRKLYLAVKKLYRAEADSLPYHNFFHIKFVLKNSIYIAYHEGASLDLVKPSALLHDLNYVVCPGSDVKVGNELASSLLVESGYQRQEIQQIIHIINDSSSGTIEKSPRFSIEAMVVSDADSTYKSLPVTPVLFAHKYMIENSVSLEDLAMDILSKQGGVLSGGSYFFTKTASSIYGKWALQNVRLWKDISTILSQSPIVRKMVARHF